MASGALVGNDVVDLEEADARGVHRRVRWLRRVLAPDELARFDASAPEADRLAWTFFAAKEAAFKVVTKLRPGTPFAHRAFQVHFAPFEARSSRGVVRHDELELELVVSHESGWVHALAFRGRGERLFAGVVPVVTDRNAGQVARAALACALAPALRRSPSELEVRRAQRMGSWDGYGPPELLVAGQPSEFDVSLSHDGRFAAYGAIVP